MHRFANPTRFLQLARPLTPVLFWIGASLTVAAWIWGLAFVPSERLMGDTVKIMFVHVPTVWLGMAGWMGIAVASIVQLVWRHPLAGIGARAVALPGAVFAAIGLMTGSIWGRPTWGTWWVWDGRLTSFLILFFLYIGYIALANASSEKGSVSRTAAVFGLIGAVNIPIINRSVVWWESQHQKPSITLGGSSISSDYTMPLFVALAGFTLLFAAIVLMRMRGALAEIKIEARMRRLAQD
jgi:heme exporter protein C